MTITARHAAEEFTSAGIVPLPVPPRRKRPTLTDWQRLRLDSLDLDAVFPEGRQMNVGVLLGEPSGGLADVDLDAPEAVAAAPLLLPATGWVSGRSGLPRSHYWYRCRPSPPRAQQAFRDPIAPPQPQESDEALDDGDRDRRHMLVELRGTGGLTIAPPSVHTSGEDVVWYARDRLAEVGLEELREAVAAVASAALLARYWPNLGGRQSAALALQGGLCRAGWPQDRVELFVRAVCVAARDEEPERRAGVTRNTAEKVKDGEPTTGWPSLAELLGENGEVIVRQVRDWLGMTDRVRATVGNVGRRTRYRPLPPHQPFPVESLPPVVSDMVKQSATAIGCAPDLVALPALAVIAGCVGNSRALLLKRGWIEPAVIWALTVAESGKHKTPAYRQATSPLTELQLDLYEKHREVMEEYEEELETWQSKSKDARGSEPKPPPEPPSHITGDTTVEALAGLLQLNGRGMLVARDELDAWFKSFTRFKGKDGGSDRPQWLEMHQAATLIINRKTGEPKRLAVRRAAVSVTGTIQPGVLAAALDRDALQAGLGARFLLAMPPARQQVWTEAELPEELADRYAALLLGLLQLEMADPKKRKPHVLGLSRPAHELWVDFYNEWGEVQHNSEGEQAAAFAKIEAYAPRLMLLHHVASHVAAGVDDRCPVTETSAHVGITLARWFAAEALRIYSMLSESGEERQTRTLVEWVASRGGRTTARDLRRSNNRRWRSSDQAEEALDDLVRAGLGRWEEGTAPERGGHRPRRFTLCTTHDTSDTRLPGEGGGEGDGEDEPPDTRRNAPPVSPWAVTASGYSPDGYGDRVLTTPGRVSEVSCVVRESADTREPGPEPPPAGRVSDASVGRECRTGVAHPTALGRPAYTVIRDAAGLEPVHSAMLEPDPAALDIETTGLDPHKDRVRLLSLAVPAGEDGGITTYVIDCFEVDPTPLWGVLSEKTLLLHNGAFDLQFLARLGFEPGVVTDTMLLSQLLDGTRRPKGYHGLREVVRRELDHDLDKGLQQSDWSGELTREQLSYAAADAAVLVSLHAALMKRIRAAGLEKVAGVEGKCLPTVAWMASGGWRSTRSGGGPWPRKLKRSPRGWLPNSTASPPGPSRASSSAPAGTGTAPPRRRMCSPGWASRWTTPTTTPWRRWTTRWRPCCGGTAPPARAAPPTASVGSSTSPGTAGCTPAGGRSARTRGGCPAEPRTCSSCPRTTPAAAAWSPRPAACW